MEYDFPGDDSLMPLSIYVLNFIILLLKYPYFQILGK